MSRTLALALTALTLSGCAEHWYTEAYTDLTLVIDQSTQVEATVITPPGAWPRDVYSQALRVQMLEHQVTFLGEVKNGETTDRAYEINDSWGDNVNVLDAWKTCDHSKTCRRTFRFEVACTTESGHCVSTVSADAFISIEVKPGGRRHEGDPIELELSEVAR